MKGRLLFAVFDCLADPDEIDAAFDFAASEHMPAIAIFPRIRDEEGVVEQLHRLTTGRRWTVKAQTVPGLTTEDFLVGIEWQTQGRLTSMPMGFAPLCTMPVTRRAPFVAIGTWPGTHENQYTHKRPPSADRVDFLDAALAADLTREQFDELWSQSTKDTKELLAETQDKASNYRSVAFRLSRGARVQFMSGGSSAKGARR